MMSLLEVREGAMQKPVEEVHQRSFLHFLDYLPLTHDIFAFPYHQVLQKEFPTSRKKINFYLPVRKVEEG